VPEASPAPESLIDIELAPPRLHGLRDLAERWALYSGFNHLDSGKILSGVDEALANIHLHSYASRPGPVHLEIYLSNEELIFEISDHGKTFDPEHGASRKAGEMGMGGWGTLMMQNGFQRIERRRVGDKNILLLACHLPVQKGDR
jgi:anti-sigma regulatory factor (Ser/Thr protein kinase)